MTRFTVRILLWVRYGQEKIVMAHSVSVQTKGNTGKRIVYFAGGGTGGHIYPNVAIAERLREQQGEALDMYFIVSSRPGDADIMKRLELPHIVLPVQPLPSLRKLWRAFDFYRCWLQSIQELRIEFRKQKPIALVTSGGFVSGPAMVVAYELQTPRVMVNLDAVPGRANRRMLNYRPNCFSVYPTATLPNAEIIGFPLRHASIGSNTRVEARRRLGIDPQRSTLFVTGATHGAQSVIEAMMALVKSDVYSSLLSPWQIYHQCGAYDVKQLQKHYDDHGLVAKVVHYCDQIGEAWRAADLCISRSGAGSVAEAWANATPTLFLPNPYHKDGHQRRNIEPLLSISGADWIEDRIDAQLNVESLGPKLKALIEDEDLREEMHNNLLNHVPLDGARRVADWIAEKLNLEATNSNELQKN